MKVGEIWMRNDLVKSVLLEEYVFDTDSYRVKWWYDNNGKNYKVIVKDCMSRIFILENYKKVS